MNINFLKNGFEIIYSNKTKKFIAFQGITQISDVKIHVSYDDYDVLLRRHFGDNVCKYCSFCIKTFDKDEIEIYLDSSIKYFRRMSNKIVNMSKFKRFFSFLFDEEGLNEEGLDEEASNWLNDKKIDMEDSVNELKSLREKMIEKFNAWSNVYEV